MNIQDSRILIKRSTTAGVVPTIPVSSDHTDGSWLVTDIYKGEIFINLADNIVYTRTDYGIVVLNQDILNGLKAPINKGETIISFGDSITDSYGLAAGEGYIDIIAGTLVTTRVNYAASGRASYKAIENMYANVFDGNEANITWMAAFNDLRRSSDSKTYLKIKNTLRAFIANAFLEESVSATDGSVTATGTWTNLTGGVIGDKASNIGGQAKFSSDVGAELEWNFTGTSLVIGTWAVDGVAEKGATIEVEIDGTVVGTWSSDGQTDGVSDGTYSNERTPTALVFKQLSNDSHNVIVRVTAVTAGGNAYVDYFGTLTNPTQCPNVFIFDIPKMNTTGYATSPNQASDEVFNLGDVAQREVIAEFPEFPVFEVYTNDFLDVDTGLQIDGIHENKIGHQQIALAFLSRVFQNKKEAYFSSINKGFIGQYSDSLLIAVNRSIDTGNYKYPSKASAQIEIFGETSNGGVNIWATNSNGGTPTKIVTISEDGLIVRAGDMVADKYRLAALNTAPANASDTGTLGEIRIDANYIYMCTATNTWKRVAIATW